MTCADPFYFDTTRDVLEVQEWMQWRNVGSAYADSRSVSYAVTGGGNKNDLLQSMTLGWKNSSPIEQDFYAIVTRGGATVALQARSRGYLLTYNAMALGASPGPLSGASAMGVGIDVGRGGLLAVGTGFCIDQASQPSTSFYLCPERTGWLRVPSGGQVTCRVDVRFQSEFWENALIDGGDSECESYVITGDTRVDMFAVPVIPIGLEELP